MGHVIFRFTPWIIYVYHKELHYQEKNGTNQQYGIALTDLQH